MKKLKYFTILFLVIMLFPLVLGFEFDNIKNYNPETKTIEIRNSILGIPFLELGKVADIKLNTPLNNLVPIGYQKVAEFEITFYEDYNNPLRTMEFYNMRNNMEGIERQFDYLYKTTKIVEDYRVVCSNNKTCSEEKLGEHEIESWEKLEDYSFDNGEIITIGVFTEVIQRDYIEWVPTFFGVRIDEWATWTSSLSVDLILYYSFNQSAGSTVPDLVGNFDGIAINMEDADWKNTGCVIQNCIEIGGTDEWINTTFGTIYAQGNNFSFSFWINMASDTGAWGYSSTVPDTFFKPYQGRGGGHFRSEYRDDEGNQFNSDDTVVNIADSNWHHIVIARDVAADEFKTYVDGKNVINTSDITTGDFPFTKFQFGIGARNLDGVASAFWTGRVDEFGIWNRTLSQAEVTQLYNDGDGISVAPIIILLNSPEDETIFLKGPTIDFNCSVDTGFTLANNSLLINGIIDQTNTSGLVGDYIFTKTFTNNGDFNWTCQGVTTTQVNSTADNRTISIRNLIENSQTFNNITTEGATEQFTINFTKTSALQVSTVDLIYNGTSNSFPYSVSGDNVLSTSSITIPTVTSETNVTFYWNITFDDSSVSTSQMNNQTIQNIGVDDCSSFTNLIYNFTQYDEENQTILSGNNTIELQINLFDLGKNILLANFSNTFTGINPVQFCSESSILPTVSYSSYVIVKYFANNTNTNESYSVEYYNILNQTISNTTIPINIALYNLKVSDTTKFRLTFRDDEFVLAPNILVQVHRQYIKDNDFKIVEIPLTDSNGQTVLNLVKDTIVYNFIMVNEAREIVGTFNSILAFCSDFLIGDCNINLAPDSLSEDIYDYNEEFDIFISDPSYDSSTEKISINFVTGDLVPKNVRMGIVRNNNFGNRSVCSASLFAASGLLSCDVSAITDTDQFLFISTFVEDDLAKQDTINLNADILNFGTLNGAFFAFMLILFLITMFMEDRKVLVLSLGLGWVGVISLGLVNGRFIGFTSAGIWILITIGIFLWKLNEEDSA